MSEPERPGGRELGLESAQTGLRAARGGPGGALQDLPSPQEECRCAAEVQEPSIEHLQAVNSELNDRLAAVLRTHRALQRLLATTDIGILLLDSSLRIRCFTERVTDLFSIAAGDEGREITGIEHSLDYEDLVSDARTILAEPATIRREVRYAADRWIEVRLHPGRSVSEGIDGVAIVFVDITERKVLEDRQNLLLSELTHRVKNSLAVVQSIANQTLRSARSPESFVEHFGGRLAALAGAHGLLVQSQWQGADFASLVRLQLQAHDHEGATRIGLDGPPVSLPADLATPFGLVMHELAANAAKYGALSRPTGKVAIRWALDRQDDQRMFAVEWRETGGPSVREPESRGFGGALIERGIPGATVDRTFDPEGVVCRIRLPLPGSQDDLRPPGTRSGATTDTDRRPDTPTLSTR